jgi:hypothetical protein
MQWKITVFDMGKPGNSGRLMAQNGENGSPHTSTGIVWAFFSPVLVAAGFLVFPFIPAICAYLDRRSGTYAAAASVLVGSVALPVLLGVHLVGVSAFIIIISAAVYVFMRIKISFAAGLVYAAAGGVLGAVVLLGLLGMGYDKPLSDIAGLFLSNQLSNAAAAGNPFPLNFMAGIVKGAEQGQYTGLLSAFNTATFTNLVSGLSVTEQVGIIRPLLEQLSAAYIPALALVGGMFTGALGYYLPVLALDRRRQRPAAQTAEGKAAAVPPFAAFKVPKYIFISLLLLQIVASFLVTGDSPGLDALNAASLMLFGSLMTVQALALLSFLMNRRKITSPVQFLLLALAALLFSWLLYYVGIFDALFDLRAIFLRIEAVRAKGKQVFTQEGLDELRKMEKKGKDGKDGKDGGSGKDAGEGGGT